ncbi:ATPase, F1/V1/A1 complex, alpha/beta subunit [Tanacetum coccineum]
MSMDLEDTMNDDTLVGVAFAVQEGVTPSVVDMTVEMEMQNSLDDTTIPTLFHHYLSRLLLRLVIPLNNPLILKKWNPNKNILKEDVSTIPVWVKLHGVPVTTFSEDGLSAIATKLADVELKDSIVVAMPKITREGHYTCNNTDAGEKKTVKKPSQTSRGVEPTIEVSNSNPFDVLNLVDNDVELLDNDRNPLVSTGIVESDSEVEVVFDEIANLRISTSGKDGSDKGYGTNSLLEQWRDSYPDNDDYDPYDDDMYKNHDLSEHLQSICDDLDITVCGGKKK